MKVFISRELNEESVLRQINSSQDLQWTAQSLIKFGAKSFAPPIGGWWFFYSKNGILFFLQQEKRIEADQLIACFGPGTAEYFCTRASRKPNFIGTGEALSTAELFYPLIEDKVVHFIGGSQSRRSLQKLYGNNISSKDLDVYDHSAISGLTLGHFAVAIMTSPMNATAFIQNNGYADYYLAIGNSTATRLKEFGIQAHLASHPSEVGLHDSLVHILSIL